MKKNFKFTDTESDALLQAYAEKKIDSFTKLLTDEEAEAAICYTEFRRSTRHQKGKVCTAEVTLEVTGKIYRVTKDEPTFKKAIDKVKDDILASIREDKGKGKKSVRTGARKAKSMLQKAVV